MNKVKKNVEHPHVMSDKEISASLDANVSSLLAHRVWKQLPNLPEDERPNLSVPTAEQLKNADYGFWPIPFWYQYKVKQEIGKMLKDPDSAKYEFDEYPRKAWRWSSVVSKRFLKDVAVPILYGWYGKVRVNAKNSYGGYVGFEEYEYFLEPSGFRPIMVNKNLFGDPIAEYNSD